MGPTAVGKTGLSLALAQAFNAEIVSADSRQFYRGIAIGTAQPTAEERALAPHHFVDFLSLDEEYSAGRFASEAIEWLQGYFERRSAQGLPRVAILVGGSGLYTQAVQDGFDDIPADPKVRAALNAQHAAEGLAPLLEELEQLDPEHRKMVDPSNPHRVIRALEVCRTSGQTYTALRKQQSEKAALSPRGLVALFRTSLGHPDHWFGGTSILFARPHQCTCPAHGGFWLAGRGACGHSYAPCQRPENRGVPCAV